MDTLKKLKLKNRKWSSKWNKSSFSNGIIYCIQNLKKILMLHTE